jgi:hypothetical protein
MIFHSAAEYAENQRKLGKVEGQLDVLNPLVESKLRAGAEKANEYSAKPKHVTKQYNLVRLLTGSGPIMPDADDMSPSTDSVKYYSGAEHSTDKAEKVRKSRDLVRMITGY